MLKNFSAALLTLRFDKDNDKGKEKRITRKKTITRKKMMTRKRAITRSKTKTKG